MLAGAPLFDTVADGPAGGHTDWLRTSDGVRIRVGHWTGPEARGTVLLFPGRTEYIEKYGRAARDLLDRGFATVAVDWRGQGLADRPDHNPMQGHVHHFLDYQKDVAAVLRYARDQGLPEPFYLIAHSMGGCIGLRALYDGLPVKAAAFSAPMWGIGIAPALRPFAWVVSALSKPLGFSHMFPPGQNADSYVNTADFNENSLTTDREMFDYMLDQLRAHPDLALGGPSLRWLGEALVEMRALARKPSPDVPTITFLGSAEDIVDRSRIRDRMGRWPNGTLVEIDGARHEVMMEGPEIRKMVFDRIASHFNAAP
ncbi:alpha/beta hydrolase [Loktanella sp. IMCC34160]|uniref:alpha/beta hydrolase n=1 Tax=Loktanella sp. IMCC34160 TaxID=2510646 RepID=UPI00101C8AB2|nr:alpha/beta hydrolase [Loktanella sp. IMCC34160]RYG90890.1 alpha/beta hydrolase [Loktanella sp. IMCC34160]